MKRIWSWFARLLTWRPAAFRKRLPTEVGIPCLKPEERQPYKRVPRTCMLVHPGNRDTYAEMLERLPPLVAEGPYDVYEGNPNPAVVAELSRYPEFYPDQNAPNPRCPVARFQKTK